MYMITSGCTATTQYGMAEMLNRSVSGEINFVEDVREYERRARRMKRIFTENGFTIVYDRDVTQQVGDGFFFTLGYPGMTGGELLLELMYYGVSSISLSTTGSDQQGVELRVKNGLAYSSFFLILHSSFLILHLYDLESQQRMHAARTVA